MLKNLERRDVAGLTLLVLVIVALASLTSYALATKANAAKAHSTGRYALDNSAVTSIDTIKVRNADCLNFEDSAATLKVVHKGYEPKQGTVTYRCVNP